MMKNTKNIFRNDLGELIKPSYITWKFSEILSKNNLRHSCATLPRRNGVRLEDIQLWLGHSSYQTTLRYSHIYDDVNKKSANVITYVFKKDKKRNNLFYRIKLFQK